MICNNKRVERQSLLRLNALFDLHYFFGSGGGVGKEKMSFFSILDTYIHTCMHCTTLFFGHSFRLHTNRF